MQPRRDGDDDSFDLRICQRRGIVAPASAATEAASVGLGVRWISARVARNHDVTTSAKVSAVHTRDEATSQERDVEGRACGWHLVIIGYVESRALPRLRILTILVTCELAGQAGFRGRSR